jgi:F-type H+-transporting ATPase subunit g
MSSAARPMLRSPALRLASRRFQSTSTEKATAAAKETASKASQGLSRVTSAAGPAIAGAARGVTGALGKMGGRTGKVIAFIERQTPFVVYYSKVGLEVAKIVFRGQKMNPPSVATFQNYYQNIFRSIQTGSIFQTPSAVIQRARNISTTQLAAGGVILAECIGFFTAGEMLGRFKVVGYHGETGSHH